MKRSSAGRLRMRWEGRQEGLVSRLKRWGPGQKQGLYVAGGPMMSPFPFGRWPTEHPLSMTQGSSQTPRRPGAGQDTHPGHLLSPPPPLPGAPGDQQGQVSSVQYSGLSPTPPRHGQGWGGMSGAAWSPERPGDGGMVRCHPGSKASATQGRVSLRTTA